MNDFETIEIFDDYLAANFAKQKLEENDIYCYLADENTVTMQWTLKNAMGGIRLRVTTADKEKALKILKEQSEGLTVDHQIESNSGEVICPNCQSNNVGTEKFSKTSIGLTWLLLGFPFPFRLRKDHRCFYCGHQWKT